MPRNGWMVLDSEHASTLTLCDRYPDDAPGGQILLLGHVATVFPSYDAARQAVRRTVTWSRSRSIGDRDFGSAFQIRRVEVL